MLLLTFKYLCVCNLKGDWVIMSFELNKFIYHQLYFGQPKHQHMHRATGIKGETAVKYWGLPMTTL